MHHKNEVEPDHASRQTLGIDGSNFVLQNATRWESKRRVMQQEKVFPQG
jgi:hypothetical protein